MTAFAGVAEDYQRVVSVATRQAWTVETLIGLLYSSSLQLRSVLSTRARAFEHDLRERLMGLAPDGRLVEEIEFTVVSARK